METRKEKLNRLRGEFEQARKDADVYKEDNPSSIFNKLHYLGLAKEIAGDLWAAYENESNIAESTKEEVINHVFVYGAVLPPDIPKVKGEHEGELLEIEAQKPTTDKMRKAVADLVAKPYLDIENQCASAAGHYKNKFYSLQEQINILKKKYDHIMGANKGGA